MPQSLLGSSEPHDDPLPSQASLSSGSATQWFPRARPGSGFRSQQCTARRTSTAAWTPSWRWGGCTGHCPEPWLVTSRAKVPLAPQQQKSRGSEPCQSPGVVLGQVLCLWL